MARKGYHADLVRDIEFHTDWTWADVCEKYGRSRDQLRETLRYHKQFEVIADLDSRSGLSPRVGYREALEEWLKRDHGATWGELEHRFKRSRQAIQTTMYRLPEGKELVQRVRKASREAGD